jgi:hypothetical protein
MIESNFHGLDFTYCASPKCENKCGRKLIISKELKKLLDSNNPDFFKKLWYGYFCDENGEVINE